MSDKETDLQNLAIDPPDNQGGGNLETSTDTEPIDPPDNQGGGGAG